jgi:glutathione synthase/RimK-type ligase-like ATP-grasp enzyme
MSKILIPTIQNDIHSAAVSLVLEQMGHQAIRWFCQDMPEAATASFQIGPSSRGLGIRGAGGAASGLHDVDVLWNRRVEPPVIKNANVRSSDRQVANHETRTFVRGLMYAVSDRSFAVNHHQAATSANKVRQLQIAGELELVIPETLISNDPDDIKAFLGQHEREGTIFKGFRFVTWDEGRCLASLYTQKVTADMLPSDTFLQLSPGIFQALVPKAFEVRVTCMGAELFAAELDSQQTGRGALDWRLEAVESMPTKRIDLPPEIAAKCRALLARLGLVFGCIDFIVTPSGDYVFLEVNQMGQFLWVEEANPEFPLLQVFAEFLVSRDPNFRSTSTRNPSFAFSELRPAAQAMVNEDAIKHVAPNEFWQIVRDRPAESERAGAQG